MSLSEFIVTRSEELGFHGTGVLPANASRTWDVFEDWLKEKHHGSMSFLETSPGRLLRKSLRDLWEPAQSIVIVIANYAHHKKLPLADGTVARYAHGQDYHVVMREKLAALLAAIQERTPQALGRICVDSAPLLEREFAERANLGFVGKNAMLITPGLGSYTLIGSLLLNIELETHLPQRTGKSDCGSCTRCVDDCPTGAILDNRTIDARRCISYLTIEHKGIIPRELRAKMGVHIFGCDICQETCPYNTQAPWRTEAWSEFAPTPSPSNLVELLELGNNPFKRWVAGTARRRASRRQWQRNICIALGNLGSQAAVPALLKQTQENPSPTVRVHAYWALAMLGENLEGFSDTDSDVQAELNYWTS